MGSGAGLRPSLTLHDLNQPISGCDLSLRGELQNALGSGGCGRYLFWWLDRVSLTAIGLLAMPCKTLAALRARRHFRNLYRLDPGEALAREIDELRDWARA